MKRWTWKELATINSFGTSKESTKLRDAAYKNFIEDYGFIGMVALAIAKWMPGSPSRGKGRPTPFDYKSYKIITDLYRKLYWDTYGKSECSD